MNRKEMEQKVIDMWLDDKISIYSLVMGMVEFQNKRGLKKLYLYSPAPEDDIRNRSTVHKYKYGM